MKIISREIWAVQTARGGSKSIPLKNLVRIGKQPLIGYNLRAAQQSKILDKIICSTDHPRIARTAKRLGALIHQRPKRLSGDHVASVDVVIEAVQSVGERVGHLPGLIVLLEPTSLFLTAGHIWTAVRMMKKDTRANSVQSVVEVPHQYHAYNQRKLSQGQNYLDFIFPKAIKKNFNKQKKPVFFVLGNVVVTRTKALLKQKDLFAKPSRAFPIHRWSGYDLDTKEDVKIAEMLLKSRLVKLR
ncbi:MAG: hypothetical protein COV74_09530 [Candidatus Omnitrophica bacterium CG11_big_fil_rev_8_21_14_0_20_45_26]|uniref:Acylneuraminate cytidylyltransferase n=1 Tax=Candidatus Abzuiibacterium crystallinum TaxID=1974748 RepID=A0A2H0LLC0_9BACT|nr:MAG: hypothetical protein COV74_09530 [Candidatus Omnitrophica bacterium CG11_big_fil_rev_8_21_14_0_20_45_26]PIW65385.1 MAG: hypothetical protein COW12_02100 [Candidatus Omnitrophica bacterium CG12_big_fil_rev_8_21_14_0_65_45_16]